MADPTIFPDDLVVGRSRNGKFKFAIVEHVAGIEDSGDSSDSEFDDFEWKNLEHGFVRVTWYPDGRSEVVQESQLQLVDRSCLPRDVVRIQDGHQLGTVISSKVICDVGIVGTSKSLKGIEISQLKAILPFNPEDHVTFGPWLGRVRFTNESLMLRFPNGARGKLDTESEGCEHIMDLYPHPSDEADFVQDHFYPGQYLSGPAKAFGDIKWITEQQVKFKPKIRYRVLVEQIELNGLEVKWGSRGFTDKEAKLREEMLAKAKKEKETEKKKAEAEDYGSSVDPEPVESISQIKDSTNPAEPPSSTVSGDDLKKLRLLNYFWYGHTCVGDRFRYKLSAEDAEKLNKQKSKTMKKAKRMKLAKRMDQKFLQGANVSSSSLTVTKKGLRVRRQQAQHDSSESSSENDDSAYDEEDVAEMNEDESTPSPSGGACASVMKDTQKDDIEVTVNTESDMNIQSPAGRRPTVLGTLSCRVAGFELDFCLIQEIIGVIVKRKFQCNIQNPEYPRETVEKIGAQFLSFMKVMLKKNKHLINKTSCAAMMSQCPHAIRKFIMQQSMLSNQEIMFEYKTGGKRTSGIIDKDGKKMEVEYLDGDLELSELLQNLTPAPEEPQSSSVDPINEFTLTCGPPAKKQAGPNVQYHAGQWITVEVSRTYTTADVQWQDGTVDKDIATSKLFPAHHVDDNDFCPGDFVIDKRVQERREYYGIVLKADGQNRMTKIQWIENGQPGEIEEVSVYEVADHESLHFRISDIIVRVSSLHSDDSAKQLITEDRLVGELLKVTELGMLEVIWADQTVSEIHPMDVIAITDENDSLFDSSDDGLDEFDDSSWVTASSEDGESPSEISPSPGGDNYGPRPLTFGIDSLPTGPDGGGEGPNAAPEPNDVANLPEINSTFSAQNESSNTEDNEPNVAQEVSNLALEPSVTKNEELASESEVAKSEQVKEPNVAKNEKLAAEPSVSQVEVPSESDVAKGELVKEPNVASKSEDMECTDGIQARVGLQETQEAENAESREEALNSGEISGTSAEETENESTDAARTNQGSSAPSSGAEGESPPTAVISSAVSSTSDAVSDAEEVTSAFFIESSVPPSHHFVKRTLPDVTSKTFMKAVQRDTKMLRSSLSPGIIVKGYEDRMDLFSVLIEGPEHTPYEDGIFVFDVYLPQEYPTSPPSVHYISFSPRLNPNLYETGRVCVSLLGTWSGKGSERWTKDSTLLQVLLSIQGLILNSEPYYNEAGYEGHRGTAEGRKNSRCYNEMVTLRLVQHMTSLMQNPPAAFVEEVKSFCAKHVTLLLHRVTGLFDKTNSFAKDDDSSKHDRPENVDVESESKSSSDVGFPLLPLSKGVMLSLKSRLNDLEAACKVAGYLEDNNLGLGAD